VLEYAAPRAFYVGINAKMFERFDERTRQQAVAPPAMSEGSDESTATLSRAMVALHSGDLKQAGQLAVLAQQQNPTNPQAAHVTRIIDREQQLQQAVDSHSTR